MKLQGYSITSSSFSPASGVCHPKNWGLDASYDMIKWYHQENITDYNGEMNKYAATKYFPWNHGVYRYFRLMNTGPQHDGVNKYSMDLAHFELFGTLLIYHFNSCNNKRRGISFSISFTVIIMIS